MSTKKGKGMKKKASLLGSLFRCGAGVYGGIAAPSERELSSDSETEGL